MVAAPVLVRPIADDRNQVLGVRALALVLEVRNADRPDPFVVGVLVLLVVAGARLSRLGNAPARLLPVDPGEQEDPCAVVGGVDRGLDVAVVAALEKREIASLRLAGEEARMRAPESLLQTTRAGPERLYFGTEPSLWFG